MSPEQKPATLRVEASALFEANQTARHQAFWLLIGSFLWIAVAVTLALGTKRTVFLVPLAPLSPLVLSLVFQTYSEVTVLGAARRALEGVLRAQGDNGLIYETAVAGIRQRAPLVVSVRLLQALGAVIHFCSVAAGLVAVTNQSVPLIVGTAVLTSSGGISAALSYRDMLRSGPVATRVLNSLGG